MAVKKILILGVTASGKSSLAFSLAKQLNAEIVCVDSMKIYKRMDIGTAKPSVEHRSQIPYHMVDVVEPSESFNVGMYLDMANKAIDQIIRKGQPVVAVGGTALYIKALLYGLFEGPGSDETIRAKLTEQANKQGLITLYERLKIVDPQTAERVHPNDAKRVIRALEVYELTGKPISTFQEQWDAADQRHDWKILGLRRQKEVESKRINARVKRMIEAGWVDEVKSLLAEEKPLSKQASCAIGYAEIIEYLQGNLSLHDAIEQIKKNTRHLAKHQRTWFRTFRDVHWMDIDSDQKREDILEETERLVAD